MTEDKPRGRIASLANVARLLTLTDRLKNRPESLPGMGVFYGYSGFGKTSAGTVAANKFGAIHIEALPFGGLKKLLEIIVAEMGITPARTIAAMFDQAAKFLAEQDVPLIIDEADHILFDKTIETIRRLHDVSQAPVILMGEENLPHRLQKWERVAGRATMMVAAEPATLQDVKLLAPIYAPGVEASEDLLRRVLVVSRHSLRRVSANLASINETAKIEGWQSVDIGRWGARAFDSGDTPAPRRLSA